MEVYHSGPGRDNFPVEPMKLQDVIKIQECLRDRIELLSSLLYPYINDGDRTFHKQALSEGGDYIKTLLKKKFPDNKADISSFVDERDRLIGIHDRLSKAYSLDSYSIWQKEFWNRQKSNSVLRNLMISYLDNPYDF